MGNYISKRHLRVDELTGLDVEARVKELNINSDTKIITIRVEECMVSPTGEQISCIGSYTYTRYNGEVNKKYDALASSSIGQGIMQMLSNDLLSHPNYEQT